MAYRTRLTIVQDVLQSISAKSDGEACCQWVGDEGAGHYVKMVHNGIEYGDMQLICEVRRDGNTGRKKRLTRNRPTTS
jgi:6-phosphogluconate dehydrogenase